MKRKLVKRKLIFRKILLLSLGKLICVISETATTTICVYTLYIYIYKISKKKKKKKKKELSSEYRHWHTGNKTGGSKMHVELNMLNDLNLAAILVLIS